MAISSEEQVATPPRPCPACGEPRTGRFCEGCGYDFVAGAGAIATSKMSVESDADRSSRSRPSSGGSASAELWTVTVSADWAYYQSVCADLDPDDSEIRFPAVCPARRFTLRGAQMRIGRRSRSRGLEPEIDLTGPPSDPAISHLHAIAVSDDRGWSIVDPGSANGITLNDDLTPIAVDVPVPLHDGDRLHLGAWTTIAFVAPGPADNHA